MTTKEVEIEVEETRMEELNICDGCGQKSSKIECKPELEGSTEWISDEHQPDPLHFCSTDCVESVRATGGVSDGSNSDGVGIGGKLFRYVLNPHNNVHPGNYENRFDVYTVCCAVPVIGPVSALLASLSSRCDVAHKAFLTSVLFQSIIYAPLFL